MAERPGGNSWDWPRALATRVAVAVAAAARRVASGTAEAGAALAYRRGELVALALLAGGVAGGAGVERWRLRHPDAAAQLEAEPPRVVPVARGRPAPPPGSTDSPRPQSRATARDGSRASRGRLVPAESPCAPAARRGGSFSRLDARSAGATPGALAESPLDLNLASPADLTRLPGIGPKLAARIVRHRETLGGFRSADDLAGVPGLGARRVVALRGLVAAGSVSGHSLDRSEAPGADGLSAAGPRPAITEDGSAGPPPHPAEDERWERPVASAGSSASLSRDVQASRVATPPEPDVGPSRHRW